MTILQPAIYDGNTTSSPLNLGITNREEVALLQVGSVSDLDVAFVTLQEADIADGPWTFVGLFSPIQGVLTQQLRIKRKKAFFRATLTVEPESGKLPLSLALIQ